MSAYKLDIQPFETDFEFEDTFESFDEFAEEVQDTFPDIKKDFGITDSAPDFGAVAPTHAGVSEFAWEWDYASGVEDEFESEAETVPLAAADSPRVAHIVPANACMVTKSGGKLKERKRGEITHVVIHTLEASYAQVIRSWQKGGGHACFKTHYVVRKDGEITQVVAEKHLPWHAHGASPYSIGIEHDGTGASPGSYTDEMYAASAALVRDICQRWGIAMDREHIIGHDVAPGNCSTKAPHCDTADKRRQNVKKGHCSCHGDPGGYWDWEYYLALVNWDGSTHNKPVRVVVDATSTNFRATAGWKRVERTSKPRHNPYYHHSWGRAYYVANPAVGTTKNAVDFIFAVPTAGTYQISAWWPVFPGNNPSVQINISRSGPPPEYIKAPRLAQNSRTGKCRKTLALPCTPIWSPVGTVTCKAREKVIVQISRDSSAKGQIVADAVRLLKT